MNASFFTLQRRIMKIQVTGQIRFEVGSKGDIVKDPEPNVRNRACRVEAAMASGEAFGMARSHMQSH